MALRDRVRGLIGYRQERRLPRRSSKPAIGAIVVCGELRMTVQAGLSEDLWYWLLEEGWRELTYRPDRRRYREIPAAWVTRLVDAMPESWPQILHVAAGRASLRPMLGDPTALPSYLERR